jgi:hypothetical protein
MVNIATIKTALTGLIGFRNSADAIIAQIDADLTATSSGTYWDDVHSLLHTDNLYYVSPNFEAMNYSAYSTPTYNTGDKVISSSIAWQSKVDNNQGNTPAVGSYWETCFSAWLRDRSEASMAKLFNKLFANKKLSGSTKSLFENRMLFEGDGKLSDTIVKSSRVVGLAIKPRNVNNIRVIIKQLGLQMTAAQTDLPIYLWHSSRKGYVTRQLVTTTGTNRFGWQAMTNFNLDFVNFTDDIDAGGTWFVGYFESDLNGYAVNKAYDFYAGPCVGCSGSQNNVTLYNLWSKYVEIMPFYATPSGTDLPAIENINTDETTNFGLNLMLSVVPDVTEIITNNLTLITYPLGLQFAVDMLEWMMTNPAVRTNQSRINISKEFIASQLYSDQAGNKGLRREYEEAVESLAYDLSNISAALPDNKPSGLSYGAI